MLDGAQIADRPEMSTFIEAAITPHSTVKSSLADVWPWRRSRKWRGAPPVIRTSLAAGWGRRVQAFHKGEQRRDTKFLVGR